MSVSMRPTQSLNALRALPVYTVSEEEKLNAYDEKDHSTNKNATYCACEEVKMNLYIATFFLNLRCEQ